MPTTVASTAGVREARNFSTSLAMISSSFMHKPQRAPVVRAGAQVSHKEECGKGAEPAPGSGANSALARLRYPSLITPTPHFVERWPQLPVAEMSFSRYRIRFGKRGHHSYVRSTTKTDFMRRSRGAWRAARGSQ